MAEINKRTVVTAKIETTSGTDAVPTGAEAVLCEDAKIKCDPDVLERRFQSESVSPFKALKGTKSFEVSFTTELKWNGNVTGNSATLWENDPLWQACGMGVVYTAEVAGDGTGNAVVKPISTTWKTASIYVYIDGLLYKAIGSAGTFDVIVEAGQIAKANYTFRSLFAVPTDFAVVTPTYDTQDGLVCKNSTFTVGGDTIVGTKLAFSINNEVTARKSIGATHGIAGFQITDRNPTGSMTVEMDLEATKDWWTEFNTDTEAAIVCNLGSTNGNQVNISLPKATWDAPEPTDIDGLAAYEVPFHLARSAAGGNDEMSLTHT